MNYKDLGMNEYKNFSFDAKAYKNAQLEEILSRIKSSYLFKFNIDGYRLHNTSLDAKNNPDEGTSDEAVISDHSVQHPIIQDNDPDIPTYTLEHFDTREISEEEMEMLREISRSIDEENGAVDLNDLVGNIPLKPTYNREVNLFTEDFVSSFKPESYSRRIEYKKVEAKYFNDRGFSADEIHFRFRGNYIRDEFLQVLDKDKQDTTVINIGTGDGKSTLSQLLIKHYASNGFVVIIANPYIVLTNRDYHELKEDLDDPQIRIVNYAEVSSMQMRKFSSANIHSITINTLLGNPGGDDDSLDKEQSQLKKSYLDNIIKHCKDNGKQVVIFFDEIHAGIKNFKTRFLHNLLKWEGLVYKVFVLSATFTEASNVVVGILSQSLTNKNITIYNSDRRKFPRQANLHIHITDQRYTSANITPLYYLKKIIEDALANQETINILVATQALTKALTDPKSEEPLAQYLCSLNPNILLGSSRQKKVNRFDPERINIGTTFNTGISITEPNNTFIIITPVLIGPDAQRLASIFMEGSPSIIQAFARVRNGGNIHVFMERPKTVVIGKYLEKLPDFFKGTKVVRYVNLKSQTELLEAEYEARDFHKKLLSQRSNMELEKFSFKTREDFFLSESQYVLSSKYEIFGKKVNPFIIWAAFNNQFTNCQLATVNLIKEPSKRVNIQEESITTDLMQIMGPGLTSFISDKTDKQALNFLFEILQNSNEVIDEFELPVKREIYYNGKQINPEQLKYHPGISKALITILYSLKYNKDENYDLSSYVLGNIVNAETFNPPKGQDFRHNLKAAYGILGEIREKMNAFVELNKPFPEDAIDDEMEKDLCTAILELRENDFYVSKNIFSILQTYRFEFRKDGSIVFYSKNPEVRRNILVRGLGKIFYDTKSIHLRDKNIIKRARIITRIKELPTENLDLIFS